MAVNEYQLTDGLWAAGNWTLGHVPDTTDQAIVPASTPVSIAGTDQNSVYPVLLEFAHGYAGNIGAFGDPLIIGAVKLVHRGGGTLWLESNGDIGPEPDEMIDWVIIDSDNDVNAANLDGEEIIQVSVRKGNVTLAATLGSVTLTTQVDVSYRDNPSSDAEVTINCALLAITGLLNMMAGKCTTNAAVPVADVSGGIHTHSNVNSTAITTANISGTGIMRYNSTGTLAKANVKRGGTLDLLDNDLAKTVTLLNLYPGGTLIYNPDLFSGTLKDLGGRIFTTKARGPAGISGPAGL